MQKNYYRKMLVISRNGTEPTRNIPREAETRDERFKPTINS